MLAAGGRRRSVRVLWVQLSRVVWDTSGHGQLEVEAWLAVKDWYQWQLDRLVNCNGQDICHFETPLVKRVFSSCTQQDAAIDYTTHTSTMFIRRYFFVATIRYGYGCWKIWRDRGTRGQGRPVVTACLIPLYVLTSELSYVYVLLHVNPLYYHSLFFRGNS